MRFNLTNYLVLPMNILSIYRINSQMEKSIIVKYPRNHSYLAASSSLAILGLTLVFHCFSLKLASSSGDICTELIEITFYMQGIVQKYISIIAWSFKVLPSNSAEPNLLMMQVHIGTESVQMKGPSFRKGKTGKAKVLPSSATYFCHACRLKILSSQLTLKYYKSSLGT